MCQGESCPNVACCVYQSTLDMNGTDDGLAAWIVKKSKRDLSLFNNWTVLFIWLTISCSLSLYLSSPLTLRRTETFAGGPRSSLKSQWPTWQHNIVKLSVIWLESDEYSGPNPKSHCHSYCLNSSMFVSPDLHGSMQRSTLWDEIKSLLTACPGALSTPSLTNHLYPFQLAATASHSSSNDEDEKTSMQRCGKDPVSFLLKTLAYFGCLH